MNDFILNNYHELFFAKPSPNKGDTSAEEQSPAKGGDLQMAEEFQTHLLTPDDFIKHPKIHAKAIEELKFCEEQGKEAPALIQDCLTELEEKGFLNLVGNQARQYAVQIREQKQKLHYFISGQLRTSGGRGMQFEHIYKAVCQ
jgi:hypothetical protein